MKTPTPSIARLASASGMHTADGGARVHTGDDVATDRRLSPAAGNVTGNRLLAGLCVGDRALLEPALEPVLLEMRQVLEMPGELISHVHFVETGLVSMIGVNRADRRIEVGMVGYEGVTGMGAVLGVDRATNEALVQSSGTALRLPTNALHEIMSKSPVFSALLLRYVHVFLMQANHTAIAAGRGKIPERLARGLLMWHDRVRADHLSVTHDFLALLLGVQRPGVTVALHELEGQGLIRSMRNAVRILDRKGLELAANGLYGTPEAEYESLLGSALLPHG
jgi:CRP-like cAMP-binding protein